MTREQILAMPAGREIDALVAEKVMDGCAHRNIRGWRHEGPDGDRELICGECGKTPSVPYYSTDIAKAWLVRDAVKTWDFTLRMHFRKEIANVVSKRVNVEPNLHDSEILLWVAPEDICRAALLAKLNSEGKA